MPRKMFVVVWIVIGIALGFTKLTAQSAVIAPSRTANWSTAGAGTIPARTTQCGTTIAAYSGSAATINQAIQNCPAGQHVKLGPGTFTLSNVLNLTKSNVTLRGSGPDQTFIKFTGGGTCTGLGAFICMAPSGPNYPGGPQNTANWTGGYAVGTTNLTLSSTANLIVGSMIVLDQNNDSNTDNGGYWVCSTAGVCASSGESGVGRSNREQMFITRVTAISGNTVTIADPLIHPNWRTSQNPGAYWPNGTSGTVTGIGVEDLSVDYTNATGINSGMMLHNVNLSWIKNIRSVAMLPNDLRDHMMFYQTSHVTVRDSYFYGKPGFTTNYGLESYMATYILIENNIGECFTDFTVTDAAAGNVYGYNYTINNCYNNPNWMQPSAGFHAPGNAFVLLEGNIGAGLQLDDIHGTADFITAFRNRFTGWEPGKTAQTVPVHNYAFSRFTNVVGNVLGTAGYHSTYESAAGGSSSTCERSIFALGWGENCESGGTPDDPRVKTTMLRWGNYDTVTGTSRFVAAEVPSGLTAYANPVPSGQTLPASLYLSARPSWWSSSVPWPAIGPDVTGGDEPNVAGHVHSIPAKKCYQQTPVDPAYAQSRTVTGATYSGGLVTLTIGSNNATVGGTIEVSGVSPAGYNGSFLVYSKTSTSVSYGMLTNPGAYSSGGTVKSPNVRLFNAATCYSSSSPSAPSAPSNLRIVS
jgi:hypothetical protein